MSKYRRTLVIAIAVISLFGLVTYTAFAEQVFEGYLDLHEDVNDGTAGPLFTGSLQEGELYTLTVEGTFSIWSINSWSKMCEGTPESTPLYPSLTTSNGSTGIDAAYLWAYPTASGFLCPGGSPRFQVPLRHGLFEISTDNGATWTSLDPVETSFSPDHIYHYEIMGTGSPITMGFRINDTPLVDNYGRLKISVDTADEPPVVASDPGGPYNDFEGSPVAFDGSNSSGNISSYSWDFGDGSSGTGINPSHTYADNDDFSVCLTVADSGGAENTACTFAYIENVAPSPGPITVSSSSVMVGTTVNANSPFTDPGTADTHTAVWDWGDGTTSDGVVSETDGSGTVAGSHAYDTPGEYAITLTVTDDDGDSGTAVYEYVVVIEPIEVCECSLKLVHVLVDNEGSEWSVGGINVKIDENTAIIDDPAVGDWVMVSGTPQWDGTITACKIYPTRNQCESCTKYDSAEPQSGETQTGCYDELGVDGGMCYDDAVNP